MRPLGLLQVMFSQRYMDGIHVHSHSGRHSSSHLEGCQSDELEARISFFKFLCVQILLFPPQTETEKKRSYMHFKAFKPDMRAGLRRPFCCIKMCEMWFIAKCH